MKDLRILLERLAPFLVDTGAILFYALTIPLLVDQFVDKSILNAFIIGAVYLLFCGSILLLKRLEWESESKAWRSGSTLAVLGIFFGLMDAYLMIDSAGFFEWLDTTENPISDNPLQSVLICFGVILWLAVVFLYAIVLAVDVEPKIPEGTRHHTLAEYVGLAGINLMIIVAMASWQALFVDTEPYQDLGFGAKVLIFVVVFAFFLLFFAPPRLVYVVMRPRPSSYITCNIHHPECLLRMGLARQHRLVDSRKVPVLSPIFRPVSDGANPPIFLEIIPKRHKRHIQRPDPGARQYLPNCAGRRSQPSSAAVWQGGAGH